MSNTTAATLRTDFASRYLQQLAKHWSHKFPVAFTAVAADIDLPLGRCRLAATDEVLEVALSAANDDELSRLEMVVADHLQRFGHRETLTFDWRRA